MVERSMSRHVTTQVNLSADGRYIKVTQSGLLRPADIKKARATSLPLYDKCDAVLVDYRAVDLSGLSFIDLDNLAAELKQDVPKCRRMALVGKEGISEKYYAHLVNVCCLKGVDTRLFRELAPAENWLREEHSQQRNLTACLGPVAAIPA